MKTTYIQLRNNRVLEIKYGIAETNHKYFSITGTIWVKGYSKYDGKNIEGVNYKWDVGGCIHDEILKYAPEYKPLVDLHLSDNDGVPMYAIENGFYYYEISRGVAKHHEFKEGDKEKYEDVLKEHLRITEPELIDLLNILDNSDNAKNDFIQFVGTRISIWKLEAIRAIEDFNLLNN